MHSKSDSIKFMISDNTDKVIEEPFEEPLDVKLNWKLKCEVVIVSFIGIMYCIAYIIK